MPNSAGHQKERALVLKKFTVTLEQGLRQVRNNYRTNVLFMPGGDKKLSRFKREKLCMVLGIRINFMRMTVLEMENKHHLDR